MIELLQLLSCFALGLLMGSLLTEAMILVPYWRTMNPDDFLRLHGTLGPQLYTYFAPLTIVASTLPIVAAVVPLMMGLTPSLLSIVPAVIMLILLAIYFAYFKGANESFKSGSVGVERLSDELARWAAWHWLRVTLGLIAFFISLLALR